MACDSILLIKRHCNSACIRKVLLNNVQHTGVQLNCFLRLPFSNLSKQGTSHRRASTSGVVAVDETDLGDDKVEQPGDEEVGEVSANQGTAAPPADSSTTVDDAGAVDRLTESNRAEIGRY